MTNDNYDRESLPGAEDIALLGEWIVGEHVYRLSSLADCNDPDSVDSVGGLYLLRVAENVLERMQDLDREDNYYRSDLAHEIADGCVPIYNADIWATFVDLGAYDVDISDYGDVDPDDITQTIGMRSLYIIAEILAFRLLGGETYRAYDETERAIARQG